MGAIGLAAAAAHPAAADPFLPVPPASFLNYHVGSADQLAQEVALDAVVRARLARHFHQTEPEVSRYIHDNLILTHLSKPGQYRVACVTPSGREYFLTQRLAAGTGVFSLKGTGKPILKQACGNPLVAVLPAIVPKKVAPPQLATVSKVLPAKPAVTAVMPSDVVFTNVPPLETAQTGSIGPFVKVAGITQSLGHSGGGGGFFPAVLGVAGLGLFAGHHGSPSPSQTPVVPVAPTRPTPTSPTPTSPIAPTGTTPVAPSPIVPTTPVTPTPIAPTMPVPITPTLPTPTTPVTPTTPPSQTPPVDTPPVFTPPTDTPPFSPPTLTPPVTTPPFIGPPPVMPPSQSAVPEPGPVVVLGLGSMALGLLRLRARRRRAGN